MICSKYKHFFLSLANGLLAKRYVDSGELVPDNVMMRLVLSDLLHLQNAGWLLDGKSDQINL